MNPITMKMIQPLAFKGYDDEDTYEADVDTSTPAKLERRPEQDEVVKKADKAPEKATEKPAEPKKPEVTVEQRMQNLNKDAKAVATGVNDFANSAATTIVGVTGGAVVVGNAAGPAVENLKKAGKAFEPVTAGIKNMIKKAGKKGAAEAGEQGTKAALIGISNINLGKIAKAIRSIF